MVSCEEYNVTYNTCGGWTPLFSLCFRASMNPRTPKTSLYVFLTKSIKLVYSLYCKRSRSVNLFVSHPYLCDPGKVTPLMLGWDFLSSFSQTGSSPTLVWHKRETPPFLYWFLTDKSDRFRGDRVYFRAFVLCRVTCRLQGQGWVWWSTMSHLWGFLSHLVQQRPLSPG